MKRVTTFDLAKPIILGCLSDEVSDGISSCGSNEPPVIDDIDDSDANLEIKVRPSDDDDVRDENRLAVFEEMK